MKAHRSVASLAATVAAVAVVVLAPGTALASSGGGCQTANPGSDALEACISASGAYLEPDGYILSEAGNCSTTYIDLQDYTTGVMVAQENVGCGTGHYGPFPYKGTNGHQYRVKVDSVDSAGIALNVVWSDIENFSD